MTSIPEDANTSVNSAASVALSTGRDGGPMEPGGGGATFEVGLAMPFTDTPFTGLPALGSCKVPKFGGGYGDCDCGRGESRCRFGGGAMPDTGDCVPGEGLETGGEKVRGGT